MQIQILSVAQVTGYLKEVLASDMLLADLWLIGEVSNLSRSAAGHVYFTVKDETSQLRCVLFRHNGLRQSYRVEAGAQVVVHGEVSLYEATGTLQLYVDLIQPAGVGAAHLQFERLRQQLTEEGLFDTGRKRPLPSFPQVIGVVTSAQGAVWQDIVTIVKRRFPAITLCLSPTLVQGDQAPAAIVAALRRLWQLERCDLIIVARGGGSAEDLMAFNDEAVARAIFASPVPVISAIGHETDLTIADLVADLRAPTPSAAAELAVPDRQQLLTALADLSRRLRRCAVDSLQEEQDALISVTDRLQQAGPHQLVQQGRQQLEQMRRRMVTTERHTRLLQRERLAVLTGRLQALDPTAVLGRGYAVVTRLADGTVVTAAPRLAIGELVAVQVQQGVFQARVDQTQGGR